MIPAIRVADVHKRYGGFQALAGVSLDVQPGEFFALLGPNGAGKTTLISIIAGLARASSGTVQVMGHDVVADYRQARRSLGVVPQELVFDPFFSVRETLRITSGYYGVRGNDAWIDEILHHLGLEGKADANMRALSGGMKRRVLVGQALVHRPPVIVLDEPTAGVDVELRHALWTFIRRLNREGHTVVLTTHYLEEAQQLCERVAMLKAGRIVALDRTDSLLARAGAGVLTLRLSGAPLPEDLQSRLLATDATHGRLRLRLDDYGEVEPLLTRIRQAGATVLEMEIVGADLEDVFIDVMQGNGPATAVTASGPIGPTEQGSQGSQGGVTERNGQGSESSRGGLTDATGTGPR